MNLTPSKSVFASDSGSGRAAGAPEATVTTGGRAGADVVRTAGIPGATALVINTGSARGASKDPGEEGASPRWIDDGEANPGLGNFSLLAILGATSGKAVAVLEWSLFSQIHATIATKANTKATNVKIRSFISAPTDSKDVFV